ncbi:8-oxo-dGTP diphosphatase [Primorskyibacter sedentarius]|uniref:8-oxo-dGTP diphosphatase n=1 Tax=Primorskyibacter sedentarius TaxID=745311 RepID=A0A4R3JMT6_9RHOB|nr:8-oxo-dGTP diphosphatase [Primorskyibacter sedentarius]
MARPGVYAILPGPGGLLLTHQSQPTPEFQLPGGGVDAGEQPLHALHREVREETGWRIARPRRLGVFRRFTFMPEYDIWAEKICTIYVAHPVRQDGPPTEPGHAACWMNARDAALALGNPGDRHFVSKLLGLV